MVETLKQGCKIGLLIISSFMIVVGYSISNIEINNSGWLAFSFLMIWLVNEKENKSEDMQ